jgi:hypothetical protein
MSRDYYLPACVVLWAAVIGNRKACQFAFEALPTARRWSAENQPHIYETARKNTRARHRNHSGQFVSNRQAAAQEP